MNSFRNFSWRDWSILPWDILFRIIESSFSLSDYIRFGAVCVQWRFFYLENYDCINELFKRRPPLFLVSPKEDSFLLGLSFLEWGRSLKPKPEISTGRFFSLLDRRAYYFQFPSLCYKNFYGSTHGWLVTVDEEEPYAVRLLNPFFNRNRNRSSSSASVTDADAASSKVINLPPLIQIHGCRSYSFKYPNKVVLSANPLSNPKSKSFVVAMALIRGNGWQLCPTDKKLKFFPSGLGFCRPGDSAWTSLPFESRLFHDVVYYKGKFYIVEDRGPLISIDFNGCFPHSDNEPKIVWIIDQPLRFFVDRMYLVESSGDLLLVYKYDYKSILIFEVFKLVGFTLWVKMETLEDRILFLSTGGSMSVSASDCPGFKPNCIYYAAVQRTRQSSHIEVFNLEGDWRPRNNFQDGSFKLYFDTIPEFSHAIWIQPTL